MRISDWSSDVCSSDLAPPLGAAIAICLLINPRHPLRQRILDACRIAVVSGSIFVLWTFASEALVGRSTGRPLQFYGNMDSDAWMRSEEHTSELQSLMRISYAVFCLKKKNKNSHNNTTVYTTPNVYRLTIKQKNINNY